MKTLPSILMAAAWLIASAGHGQDPSENAIAPVSGRVQEGGLETLPGHLKADPDRLSLRVDFQSATEGWVTAYLVNPTKEPMLVESQDGDLFCKREARMEDGLWRRCDSHHYSWCGNSYVPREVPAGRLLFWQQKLDSAQGKPRSVRFKLFQNVIADLVSNEGTGNVQDEDITLCRYDAMAMRTAPFADVVAVATGKVKGSHGSSTDRNAGVWELERFYQEADLFSVLKRTVDYWAKARATDPAKSGEYADCLRALQKGAGISLSPQDAWNLVAGHVRDPSFPWRDEALRWLGDFAGGDWLEALALADKILSEPSHPAARAAVFVYAKYADSNLSGPRLAAIARDEAYSEDVRRVAQTAQKELFFASPLIQVRVEAGEASADQPVPLKTVTITNVSPQWIALPVANAEDLLIFELRDEHDNKTYVRRSAKEIIRLEVGKPVVLKDVRWWKWLDPAMIKEGQSYTAHLRAATPGMSDTLVDVGWWSSVEGAKLRKAIQKEELKTPSR
ncbi:MAG: hypothetical protein V4662_16395 [Verrucomicrobiota bacterium]